LSFDDDVVVVDDDEAATTEVSELVTKSEGTFFLRRL
jgi:hypothetical protein